MSGATPETRLGANVKRPTDLPPRLAAKVEVQPDGCWRWTASTSHGYGMAWHEGKMHPAHRLVWWFLTGCPLPEQLHHVCRNPRCVNPAHLQPTTLATHPDSPAVINAAKTECPVGHAYTPENTYLAASGKRSCTKCMRKYTREWKRERTRKRRAAKEAAAT